MPNPRLVLWLALGAILYLNYLTWMHDYAPPVSPTTVDAPLAANAPPGGSLANSIPTLESNGATNPAQPAGAGAPAAPVPSANGQSAAPVTAANSQAPLAAATAAPSDAPKIHVVTDVLDVIIDTKGGELQQANLLKYPLHKNLPNVPMQLFNRASEGTLYVLQSGLTGANGEPAPDHLATWTSVAPAYSLVNGTDELRVPLTWTDGKGLNVTKTFVFRRGRYGIDLLYDVDNTGAGSRKLASYAQLLRHWEHASRSYFDVETYSFKGPAVDDGKTYRRLNVENDDDKHFDAGITNGWLASMQHYFVSAIVPAQDQVYAYKLQVANNDYLLSATGPATEVRAGGHAQFKETVFTGPKLQDQLASIRPRLELTADYGKLTVIAKPLFLALKWVHSLVGNWGWSIILVTALIKLMFYPLSQASGRSMAKMRSVGPRMKQLQDNYKDDREKLGRAMMDLYKREKINPVAGCLPMVIQIPVFISFYWVLLETVEMRQAPFMLWITDLSSRDPFFVLPVIMGGAMFMQYRLNPAPPDPMQAKIMQFMPLVMTAMMAWFPAGLTLYWITNTGLSILQQWRINQVTTQEAAKRRN